MRGGRGRDDDEARLRAEASLRSIEEGGLPLPAQERLRQLRAGDTFTSDLTANELLLVREAGLRPLTQVMGSCFYQVGWQWLPAGTWGGGGGGMRALGRGDTYELETETEAWNEARRLAVGRLAEEARLAGADAVVAVRIERGTYDWAQGLIEFSAIGTAVRSERYDLGGEPLLSNLSGAEFAALLRHGWWPAGLVAGTTVAYVVSGWQQQQAQWVLGGTRFQNQEFTDFTQGVYDARAQAMLRATRQAHQLGAHGLLGVTMEMTRREHEVDQGGGAKRTDAIVTLHVLATAVAELAQPPDGDLDIYTGLPLT